MVEFIWPWVFLFLPLPLLVIWYNKQSKTDEVNAIVTPFFDEWQEVSQSPSTQWSQQRQYLFPAFIWLLILTASANPAFFGTPITLPSEGREIMIAVDVSGSMKESDMKLNGKRATRLDVVKQVLSEFIDRRQGDRLGLVLFGEQAYLQCPLTFDRKTIATFLEESVIGIAGTNGTAIGDGVGMAIKRFQQKENSNRVLVLLTDGQNNVGVSPEEAATLAAKRGITIYTIGIGAESVTVNDMFFGPRVVNPSKDLDEATLKSMAKTTGGQYFRGRDQKELEAIYQKLDELEPIAQEDRTYRPKKLLFPYPLGLATLLLILMLMIPLVKQWRQSLLSTNEEQDT